MKRWLLGLAIVLIVAAGAFFGLAPGMTERSLNKIDGKPLAAVSDHARALHKTLTIVDLHSDTLLWQRSLLTRAGRGHVDLPRLEDGNVALQVFSSVTKTPKGQNYDANGGDTDNITALTIAQLQPPRTWTSLLERSLWHAEKLHRAVAKADGKLIAVAAPADIDALLAARAAKARPVGAMLSIEGLQDLEGDIRNLDRLHAAGFRMAGLAHFFDNDVAGSMHGIRKYRLTPLGRKVVPRMEELGMIVDIAHCSRACVADILKIARRPVVSSHGGVQATCKVNRNLDDEQIRGVAATGGLVGIGYWDAAICDTSPASIAKAMKHVRDLVGIQYVALGSDYDGGTTVRFDTSKLVQVTQALIDAGFTDDEIRAAMGGNAIRVLRAGIVPMKAAS
ncbi:MULTISPECIES: dipeptidase [unclassified Sphingopyxis]|uniref:dipeptidase n=1 Tax=unclassified Sphingopyxis TaxID=2614943 RepID=UPI0007309F9E|nr:MULTISPECIES: dipeptidase [unclassified Sphingopyxis]KTE21567.1 peptidase M19 [Sphingopyxis sp. H057]KTE49564.1 peptidase M19 [Sphingopyxis sp. H073]KTE49779.1 peptidase M19 [Sphingopyxis sp. H071]KTE58190.1 peptidase M19 [Sphingopyxis sp. H107]KTE62662.1 peptidase M19 [Sphingopyxis sp. H100]